MQQLSLFEEQTASRNDHQLVGEVMRQRLLACLETTVCAIEVLSDLPEYENSVWMGVTCREHRREKICSGYTHHPELMGEHKVASMLLWSVAQFVFPGLKASVMLSLKMREVPPQSVIKAVVDLLEEYRQAGGQIGEHYHPIGYPSTIVHLSKKEQQALDDAAKKYEENAQQYRQIEEAGYNVTRELYPDTAIPYPFAGPFSRC